MRYLALGLVLSLGAGMASGASTLCTKGEVSYFSCKANTGKTISLCGQVFSVGKAGVKEALEAPWLQYRYGRPGALELVYPAVRKDSLSRFTVQRIRAGGGAYGVDGVAFVSGGIGYSVDSVTPETGDSWQGVNVGDPKDFDLERGAKPRAHYPSARIVCAEADGTQDFSSFVDFLDRR
jgi:hypothetical protein